MPTAIYEQRIAYDITKIENDENHLFFGGTILSPSELRKLKHDRNAELKAKLKELSDDAFRFFNIDAFYYKQCWNINGIQRVSLNYKLGGYAVLSIRLNHRLSAQERNILEESIEVQMIEGYGGLPFELFSDDNYQYRLEI